tara:strand:+ start:224 stop:481 length:258 start_codon:yes stop_codon:yes gene_type:complete
MPIYNYNCKNCGHEEGERLVTNKEAEVPCPQCKTNMEYAFPSVSFTFKDAGLQKHLRKYGNSNEVVPKTKGNGVQFYAKPKKPGK